MPLSAQERPRGSQRAAGRAACGTGHGQPMGRGQRDEGGKAKPRPCPALDLRLYGSLRWPGSSPERLEAPVAQGVLSAPHGTSQKPSKSELLNRLRWSQHRLRTSVRSETDDCAASLLAATTTLLQPVCSLSRKRPFWNYSHIKNKIRTCWDFLSFLHRKLLTEFWRNSKKLPSSC